eukprot:352058-Chlamydomonas_euryale.AAC.6
MSTWFPLFDLHERHPTTVPVAFTLASQWASLIGKLIDSKHGRPSSDSVSPAFLRAVPPGFRQHRLQSIALRASPQEHCLKSLASFFICQTAFAQNLLCSPAACIESDKIDKEKVTIPHYALLASVGIAPSTLGPDLLCPWYSLVPLACPLFHFTGNRLGRAFWFFCGILLAARLEHSRGCCLIPQTVLGCDALFGAARSSSIMCKSMIRLCKSG